MSMNSILKKINPLYLEDLKSEDHFSVFINEPEYQIIILRGISIKEDELAFLSKGFFVDENLKVYHYDYVTEQLSESEFGFDKIHKILAPIYEKNNQIIDEFVSEIDKLEDELFERNTSRIFMDNWFDLKKDMARIERYYLRNYNVIQNVYKSMAGKEKFPDTHFKDLLQDVNYTQHHLNTQISRLDALYSYYGYLKNDKLNSNLYTLTVLSAVFLPLNLVVGFFGMNTENLFFKDNPMGTKFVLMILVGSFLVSIFGIPVFRLLDRYVLRLLLGRSHIYKKVSSKLDKIENILKLDN